MKLVFNTCGHREKKRRPTTDIANFRNQVASDVIKRRKQCREMHYLTRKIFILFFFPSKCVLKLFRANLNYRIDILV